MLIFNISGAVWYNIYKSLRVRVRVLIYTGAHCTHTQILQGERVLIDQPWLVSVQHIKYPYPSLSSLKP